MQGVAFCGIDIGVRVLLMGVVSAKVGVTKPPRTFAVQYTPTFLLFTSWELCCNGK